MENMEYYKLPKLLICNDMNDTYIVYICVLYTIIC
jgi:hypothetical protein